MKYFVYISLIFLSPPLFSNEVEIIKLHENKSLDQLVLDQIENENSLNLQITNTDNDEIKLDEEIDSQNLIESEILSFEKNLDIKIKSFKIFKIDKSLNIATIHAYY